jgi:hypothetical protein
MPTRSAAADEEDDETVARQGGPIHRRAHWHQKDGRKISAARQVKAAVAGLKALDVGAIETAFSKRIGDLPDDDAVAKDVLGLLASVGVPGAFEIEATAKLIEI